MRKLVVLVAAIGIGIVACTATVSIYKDSIESRVDVACHELAVLCQSSGKGCEQSTAFCGPLRTDIAPYFTAEDQCKAGCGDDLTCVHQCKDARMQHVSSVIANSDLKAAGSCQSLSDLCSTSPEACPANEFFCTIAAPAPPTTCSVELDACKATCAKRDRVCRGACRDAYATCLAGGGGTMPDGGVPDAPPTTTTTWNLTYGTTATSTGTGTIARNPAGTSCGTNCATYAANTSVTLTATPSTGSTFGGWTGCTSTTNTCTVTMTMALTVTARFTLAPVTTYDLTYGTTSGSTGTGTIARNPAGTSCGASCATYAANTSVTLTATPSTGSTFGGWTGCTSTTNVCTVTMTQALTVTARFTLAPVGYTYTKDISVVTTGYCNGCHSGAGPDGNYNTSSYTGMLGNGSDGTPNVIPGNAASKFVIYMQNNHKSVNALYPGFDKVAYDWVVLYNAKQ